MTVRSRRLFVLGVVAIATVGASLGAWLWASGRLSVERQAMLEEESKARSLLLTVREQRERRPALDARIDAVVQRTLGGDLTTVDSTLRARLNRLGETERVKDLIVSTAGNAARESPAKTLFSRAVDQRALRSEIDFVELAGVISGEATLNQALRLVSRIEAEPWLKRIDEVRLDASRDGNRVRFTVRVTTLFLPGRVAEEPVLGSDWTPKRLGEALALLETNPFALPPKPEAPVAVAVSSDPPPAPTTAPFPYEEWLVTAIVDGPTGPEVWLRNGRTGATRTLSTGQAIEQARLVAVNAGRAEFALGSDRFAVELGRSLGDRVPVGQ
ncbi:MAG: hypothetical protein KDA22_12030 [Phycisphaerales bacterium]|nr:hypothetical protein [Phycisphaerales bacterium]